MIPALGSRLGFTPSSTTADPEAERYLLFAAVIDLLVRASEDQALVIVLDDLQWADKPSFQLLRHVVATIEPLHALIVVTYRNTDFAQSDSLVETLAALRREPGVSRIDLKGLGDAELVAFLERSKGTELSEAELGLAHAALSGDRRESLLRHRSPPPSGRHGQLGPASPTSRTASTMRRPGSCPTACARSSLPGLAGWATRPSRCSRWPP